MDEGGTAAAVPPAGPPVATPRALRDILAGLTFVAFGLAFAVLALGYQVGTPGRMGPGFFPLALAVVLVVLGGVIVFKGFVAAEGEVIGVIPWRAIALILGAVVFFGLTVRGLGVIPATIVTALMSTFASRRTGLVGAVLITIGLTILCVLIFVVALRLRLPLIGPWIPV